MKPLLLILATIFACNMKKPTQQKGIEFSIDTTNLSEGWYAESDTAYGVYATTMSYDCVLSDLNGVVATRDSTGWKIYKCEAALEIFYNMYMNDHPNLKK